MLSDDELRAIQEHIETATRYEHDGAISIYTRHANTLLAEVKRLRTALDHYERRCGCWHSPNQPDLGLALVSAPRGDRGIRCCRFVMEELMRAAENQPNDQVQVPPEPPDA